MTIVIDVAVEPIRRGSGIDSKARVGEPFFDDSALLVMPLFNGFFFSIETLQWWRRHIRKTASAFVLMDVFGGTRSVPIPFGKRLSVFEFDRLAIASGLAKRQADERLRRVLKSRLKIDIVLLCKYDEKASDPVVSRTEKMTVWPVLIRVFDHRDIVMMPRD